MKSDKFIKIAIFFGTTGIIFGALASHTLANYMSIEKIASFKTGVEYQIFNSLFLLIISLNLDKFNPKISNSINLISTGILLFSFSIYFLAHQEILGINFSYLGPVTPLGGLLLIFGWVSVLFAIKKNH
tara:strand:- start:5685 stop:6071 length:387 start_codon:yes stop_codon:yes gene_type:complete